MDDNESDTIPNGCWALGILSDIQHVNLGPLRTGCGPASRLHIRYGCQELPLSGV